MKLKYIITVFISVLLFTCSKDDSIAEDPFVVAFDTRSVNMPITNSTVVVSLVYSQPAKQNGNLTIGITDVKNAIYGVDYITVPEAVNNVITLDISEGKTQDNITFTKLANNTLDDTSEIEFTINNIDYSGSNIQGFSSIKINSLASEGGSLEPLVGGPNEPNQVYIDLSTQNQTTAVRDSWDLGFYGGNEFRVVINGSIYMATRALTSTDIDAVTQADVASLQPQVAVGTFNPQNANYVDAPNGSILETAIQNISEDNNENPVYLVNLGYEVGTNTPTIGSAGVAGDPRGWKKIRILRDGDNYVLQYADLNATTHQEVTISKNPEYNFMYFSFNTNSTVNVEPKKQKWDVCFTVFTNILTGAGSYGFTDFVTHNRKGGVTAYAVKDVDFGTYMYDNIDFNAFEENQTIIGSTWRDVFSRSVFDNIFYILKDSNNNIYKIRFLTMTNTNGERGYPKFEYQILKQQE